jgi:hypothetical protein
LPRQNLPNTHHTGQQFAYTLMLGGIWVKALGDIPEDFELTANQAIQIYIRTNQLLLRLMPQKRRTQRTVRSKPSFLYQLKHWGLSWRF